MISWMDHLGSAGKSRTRVTGFSEPARRPPAQVPVEYRPLYKYLEGRYANTVVLTFAEVEDLIGFPLPELARTQPEWWANADTAAAPSPQSHAWTEANRTATLHLLARNVAFEGTPA